MAYYNASGQITIDEAAASADIQKIRGALQKLEDSQNSLRKLQSEANNMHGQTGAAIVEKSASLQSQISALKEKLEISANYIRKTVDKYREEDRRLAQMIRSGGGV